MELLRSCISIAGIIFIVSFLLIGIQLKRWGVYSFTDMRHNPLWPMIIFEYKKYTKNNFGKVGALYLTTVVSGLLLVGLLMINLLVWILSLIPE